VLILSSINSKQPPRHSLLSLAPEASAKEQRRVREVTKHNDSYIKVHINPDRTLPLIPLKVTAK